MSEAAQRERNRPYRHAALTIIQRVKVHPDISTAHTEWAESIIAKALAAPAAPEAPELPPTALNHALAWLERDGEGELADDTIVKLADATGKPFAHITAGWLRELIAATSGVRFGTCHCGRDYGDHTAYEQAGCDGMAGASEFDPYKD